jgi:transcriptional regulator NrdR family protein
MTRHLADGRTVRRRACYICENRWYSLQAAESAVAATMLQWRGKQLMGVLTS